MYFSDESSPDDFHFMSLITSLPFEPQHNGILRIMRPAVQYADDVLLLDDVLQSVEVLRCFR